MPTPADDSSYEGFLTTVRPVSMDLSSCAASLNRALYWKMRESKPRKGRRDMLSRYRINHVGPNYFDVEGEFTIEITEPDTSERALKIDVSFLCHLHAERPVSAEHAERFANSEFRVVIWPYFRQFVSDTTARMGIPPLVIPVSIGRPEVPPPSVPRRALSTRVRRSKASAT